MKAKIGTVTIGQSPRVDVIPELAEILGPGVEIVEAGALDGLSKDEIAALAPAAGDDVLVSRLADGSYAKMAARHVEPRLLRKVDAHFASGISTVVVLCSWDFPDYRAPGMLIFPQRLLLSTVVSVARGARLGVVYPAREQEDETARRWSEAGGALKVIASSPYADGEEGVRTAARTMKEWGAEIVVLDCIGYTRVMQESVREITGGPAISTRGVVAHTLRELFG